MSPGLVWRTHLGGPLVWSTFLAGGANPPATQDSADEVAVDAFGRTYVCGSLAADTFPPATHSAFQSLSTDGSFVSDAFLVRLSAATGAAKCATLFGGNGLEGSAQYFCGVARDDAGCAWISGQTSSLDLPTTQGAAQAAFAGGGGTDGFLASFDTNASGASSLLFATYIGGFSANDTLRDVEVDGLGNAHVTGSGGSFPMLAPFQGCAQGIPGVYAGSGRDQTLRRRSASPSVAWAFSSHRLLVPRRRCQR